MPVSVWNRRILVHEFQYRLIAGNFLYLFSVVLAFLIVLFGPVAAVLSDAFRAREDIQRAAVVISGGNVDLDTLPWG